MVYFVFIFCMCTLHYVPPTPRPFTQIRQNLNHQTRRSIKVNTFPKIYNNGISYCVIPQILLIGCGLMSLLWWLLLKICVHVKNVPFNVNLNLYRVRPYVICEYRVKPYVICEYRVKPYVICVYRVKPYVICEYRVKPYVICEYGVKPYVYIELNPM